MYAYDASNYLVAPQAVSYPNSNEQVRELARACDQDDVALTVAQGGLTEPRYVYMG